MGQPASLDVPEPNPETEAHYVYARPRSPLSVSLRRNGRGAVASLAIDRTAPP